MVNRIKVLSEETINQIAAGEVIESPSSVVKELVENSLDAGASSIVIEVLSGGFQLIRISDDGSGMSQDDAILSFERHATSKVRKIEDLLTVSSMGFRGEALASIASISKMTMITSLKGQKHQGIKILCEAGKMKSIEPHPRTHGTTIEVKALFYPVPARKKFQKSPAQALCDIHKAVSLLALSRSDVEFKLLSHDKLLIDTTKTSMQGRIEEVLGKEYGSAILPISYEETWMKIEGFIGTPVTTRVNRTGQYIFINQRGINSSAVSYAVSDGYGTMLGVKRYPIFVLHMKLSSELLDVNVHPQKKEVRFKEESILKEGIRKAVGLSLQKKQTQVFTVCSKDLNFGSSFDSGVLFSALSQERLQDSKSLCSQSVKESVPAVMHQNKNLLPWECGILPKVQDLQIVGIYRQYLLVEGESADKVLQLPNQKPPYQGLLMIDLKAAATRIYFDSVMCSYEKKVFRVIEKQALLFPITLRVTSAEAFILQEALEEIQSLGIEIRSFGENTFIIDACAVSLDEELIKQLLHELIEDLKVKGCSNLDRQKKLAIRTSQITSSKKKRYDLEEAKKILSELLKTEQPYFCPLGKKTISYLSSKDYEKLFNKDSY